MQSRMKHLLPVLIVLFSAFAAYSQNSEFGSIEVLKGKTKYFVVADSTEDRNKIVSELRRRPELVAVSRAEDAEFFVEYKQLDIKPLGSFGGAVARGEMTVYTKGGDTKLVAWSNTATAGAHKAATPGKLAGQFVSALKKASR